MTTSGPFTLSFNKRLGYQTSSAIELAVTLRVGNAVVDAMASVDTGSTYTVFARAYAEILGLAVENGAPTTLVTLTGKLKAFQHRAQIEIEGLVFECDVHFFEDASLRRNFLGRNWLRLCRVGIVEHDAVLYLSHY